MPDTDTREGPLTRRTSAPDGADVRKAIRRVDALLAAIRSPSLRRLTRGLVRLPTPLHAAALEGPPGRRALHREFLRRGWLEPRAPSSVLFPAADASSFETSPGGGAGSHHTYPGGLAVHLATGGGILLSLARIYREGYGVRLDPDLALAAWLLHDHMKPVVLRWERGARIREERRIAGTRAHHVLGLANLVALDAPRDLVLAAASAHAHPAENEARVAGFLEAAALLAGRDPVRLGLLARAGRRGGPGSRRGPRPRGLRVARPWPLESFLVHFADRDWPFATHLLRRGVEKTP